jgi:CBS domain-containing membrane protein
MPFCARARRGYAASKKSEQARLPSCTLRSKMIAQRDIDVIAEYADSSIRATVPVEEPVKPRHGSLPGIKLRRGFNEFLYRNWGNRGNAVYTFLGSLMAMALAGGVAWGLDEPLLFPSLGATAFLMFETPMAEVSSPRNAMIGHLVGAAVAYVWLWVFDLIDRPTAIIAGFNEERWIAIALSLAFTGGILRLLRAAHPPAGATTVIVSLGLLDNPHQMVILACGAALVVFPAIVMNRLMGVPAPYWSSALRGPNRLADLFRGNRQPAPAVGVGGNAGVLFGGSSIFTSPVPGQQLVGQGQQTMPAGWYTDPLSVATQRYWDGSNWTEQTK